MKRSEAHLVKCFSKKRPSRVSSGETGFYRLGESEEVNPARRPVRDGQCLHLDLKQVEKQTSEVVVLTALSECLFPCLS